jgi:hypothetical protein
VFRTYARPSNVAPRKLYMEHDRGRDQCSLDWAAQTDLAGKARPERPRGGHQGSLHRIPRQQDPLGLRYPGTVYRRHRPVPTAAKNEQIVVV